MRLETERKMRRWREQRWLLDQVIQTRGLDWDQGRTGKILRNCGPGVQGDIQEISRRVQKFVDIPREFGRVAARREDLAREAEQAGHLVDAREHYYIAATFFTNATWGVYEDGNERRIAWAERKRACYDKFVQYAGRPIERVELPYEGKSIAALLERGLAVLAIDGPGQGETRERGIKCTASNYEDTGKLACDYLVKRPEIDPDHLAIMGSSMGSYWGPRVAAVEPRFKACAVSGVNVEPGQNTIFNSASPTFKLNYMYMAGYDDEAAFDEFAKTLTLSEVAPKIRCPYLIVAGEDDDLCPIEFVYQFMNAIPGPKVLVVYEGEKHSIRNPRARTLLVDWLADRLAGKPFKSERIYVEMSGKETHMSW